MMNDFRLNEQIAFLRRSKGITQEELARALGVTNQSVSKWESAQCCPDIMLLPDIAAFFGVTIDQLMGYSGIGTSNDLPLQLRTVIDNAQPGDDARLALRLVYTIHAVLFSKEMQSGGNAGWNPDDAIEHAGRAEWGMSCVSKPNVTTRMRYGSVFFSDNNVMHPEDSRISELCRYMRDLSDRKVLKTLVALYTLTVKDENIYADISEIAEIAGLSGNTVSEILENELAEYISRAGGDVVPCYRINGKHIHVVPLLSMLVDP